MVPSPLRRLALLLLSACQGAAVPEAVVAQARSLASASPELHGRLAAARPLDGLEGHGGALLKTAPHRALVARLPEHAAAPLAASDSGGPKRSLTLTLRGAAQVRAQAAGDWLVYGGALPDTDLTMFAGDTLVEALFVMRTAAAPRQVDYRLALADGLHARASALGLELVDASGDAALRIPPARAFDAQGTELPVRQWLEGDVLHLALQREPAAWPVLLDPVVELAVWQQVDPGDPLGVSSPAAVYDSARDRVVLYGGAAVGAFPTNDTWEWDGTSWQLVSTGAGAPTYYITSAYDPVRRVTVVFGATNAQVTETWEWDGNSWSMRSNMLPPDAVWRAGTMAWDGAGQRLLLFGGIQASQGSDSQTMKWDGVEWSSVADAGPPQRSESAAAYDPGRGVVVAFGGFGAATNSYLGDTWELSGSVWTQRSPAPPLPAPRADHVMSYSEARGTVLLSGGHDENGVWLNDLWEWNGTSWSELPTPPFVLRAGFALLDDTRRRRNLVMMGSDPITAFRMFADVWAWDGGTWQDITPLDRPSRRTAAALAYDSSRKVATLFGGNYDIPSQPVEQLQDTWEWNGASWSARPGPQPSATLSPAMAFDARRGLQVLSTNAGETWEWDGGAWQQRPSSLSTPATALAYDGVRGVTVAVIDGGVFEYAGSTWAARAYSGPAPLNATQFGLAADAHGRTWLFGGELSPGITSSQLWAWDGGGWAQLSAPASFKRESAAWSWDTARDVGMLFGGVTAGPAAEDTRFFSPADGGTWTTLSGTHPKGRINGAFAYDSRRGRGVLFGGEYLGPFNTYLNDTWELAWLRAKGSDCTDASQCASGFCTDGVCCTTASCSGRCGACNLNGLGTCSALPSGSAGSPPCAPYLCDGTSLSCPASCSGDAGCTAGASCTNGACAPSLMRGADCSNDGQCLSGHCVGNICCTEACDGGCQTCRQSEGASEDGVCGARPTGHACRGASDQCDVAESCDGVSSDCPSDRFVGPDVMCRGAADTCDVPEFCTGSTAQCPKNELKSMGTTCTSSLQICAAAAQCDGVSPLCPVSAPALAQTPCRSIAGPCDRPEVCDGVHLDCPADELLPAGTSCGEEQQCVAECNGTSVECQACPPVSRFAFGCAAVPGQAAWLLLFVLRRRRK